MLGLGSKQAKIFPADARQWVDTERAYGARPSDQDLEGLKAAGVITLLHITMDGLPSEEDQRRCERRGLNYVSISLGGTVVDAARANHLLDVLNARHNGPYYVYDDPGKLSGAAALLFKAIPNFWKFERYAEEAGRRGVDLNAYDGLEKSIRDYMKRYVRGRR